MKKRGLVLSDAEGVLVIHTINCKYHALSQDGVLAYTQTAINCFGLIYLERFSCDLCTHMIHICLLACWYL